MKDKNKTKEKLIEELIEQQQLNTKLKAFKEINKKSVNDLELFKNLINQSNDALYIVDSETTQILNFNDTACKTLGYTRNELLKMRVTDICISKNDYSSFGEKVKQAKEKGHLILECDQRRKDGTTFTVELNIKYVSHNESNYLIVVVRNITDRKSVEIKLQESEEMYRSLVESTEDSIYLVDKECKFLFMNKNYMKMMGLSGNEYLRRSYSEFHSTDDTKWFVENVNRIFKTGRSIKSERKNLKDDRYFLFTFSPVKNDERKTVAVTAISKEITHLKQMEEELRTLSITDELTGVYNRRGFFALAGHQLKLSNRLKKGIYMLYADLDGLKEINDRFGHKEGDMALVDLVNILKTNYRDSDIVARIGGDEFVVIPVGFEGDSIDMISSRLQKKLEIHNSRSKRRYKLSVSIGIVYYNPQSPHSIDELISQADMLMYENKRKKKNS